MSDTKRSSIDDDIQRMKESLSEPPGLVSDRLNDLVAAEPEMPDEFAIDLHEDETGLIVICDLADLKADRYVARAFCPRDMHSAEILFANLRMSFWLTTGQVSMEALSLG